MNIKVYQTNIETFNSKGEPIRIDFDGQKGVYTKDEWGTDLLENYDLNHCEIGEILETMDIHQLFADEEN
jgi:hypothetical protein